MNKFQKAVILTALPVEYEAIRNHLNNIVEEIHSVGTIYEKGIFLSWNVLIAEIGPGNEGAAMEVERAIQFFDPDIILFVGIAGGIKDVTIGDVVAAKEIYHYESGKVKEDFYSRPKIGKSTHFIVQRAIAEAKKRDWIKRFETAKIEEPYWFRWDEIPGEDCKKLIKLLRQNYGINWVKTAKVEKIDDDKTIRFSKDKKILSLKINLEKTMVNLEINGDKVADFFVKIKNGRLSIYKKPKAIIGPIAACPKVVSSPRSPTYNLLKENYNDALAVEMEGYGFLEAVHAHKKDALVIRGISDLIDGKENADSSGSQKLASNHASCFAFEMLAKLSKNFPHNHNFEKEENPPIKEKPLKDYTHIYHISGMTVTKKQLSHLVVAPKHYSKNGYLYSSNILKDERDFKFGISPIYFSSLSDPITSQLLNEGLKGNRSNARIHLVMSDFPHIKMPFIRYAFIETNININIEKNDKELKKKGIRALSYYLDKIVSSKNKNNLPTEENRTPIKIYLDIYKDENSFYKSQDYTDFHELLYTLVILAGNKKLTEVTDDKDQADVILSLCKSQNSIPIPIFRFIPVAISNTNIYELFLKSNDETKNFAFLTVGGSEHNKLLELFIALHRWGGGETVFNHSNYFDRTESKMSSVSLFTEAFVGGIVDKGTEQHNTEEIKRKDKAAFVISFIIPTYLPWSIKHKNDEQYIKIIAIIGMSAVLTTLGIAYVSFLDNFIVKNDEITLIKIPGCAGDIQVPIGTNNPSDEQKDFILEYIKYLQNKTTKLKVSLPGEVYIETLLNPIENEIFVKMKDIGFELDKQYELNAELWSFIAKKYLLKKY